MEKFTPEQVDIIADRVFNLITPAMVVLEEILDTGQTTTRNAQIAYETLASLIAWVREQQEKRAGGYL